MVCALRSPRDSERASSLHTFPTGRERQPEVTLPFPGSTPALHYRARTYFPEIARFAQRDPISRVHDQYLYVNNNPLGFHDPTGLQAEGLDWYFDDEGGEAKWFGNSDPTPQDYIQGLRRAFRLEFHFIDTRFGDVTFRLRAMKTIVSSQLFRALQEHYGEDLGQLVFTKEQYRNWVLLGHGERLNLAILDAAEYAVYEAIGATGVTSAASQLLGRGLRALVTKIATRVRGQATHAVSEGGRRAVEAVRKISLEHPKPHAPPVSLKGRMDDVKRVLSNKSVPLTTLSDVERRAAAQWYDDMASAIPIERVQRRPFRAFNRSRAKYLRGEGPHPGETIDEFMKMNPEVKDVPWNSTELPLDRQ